MKKYDYKQREEKKTNVTKSARSGNKTGVFKIEDKIAENVNRFR